MYSKALEGRVAGRAHITNSLIIILIFLIISSLAEAQTQGHPFSQIYYVDTNINISGFNITNVSYLGIGTISPAYPLDVAGTERITDNLYVGGNLGIRTVSPQNALNVIGDINATGMIYGTLGSDTVNTTSLIDSAVTDAKISEVNWTKLQNYPPACGSDEVVQGINDTLACINIITLVGNVSGSGALDYIPVWTGADTLGNSYIYQSGGLIYTTSGFVLGGNMDLQNTYSIVNATYVNASNIYSGGSAVLTTATSFGGNVTGNSASIQLAPDSVGASQILNGAITSAKLVPDLSLGWANLTSYPADCPGGYFVTGANDTDFKCALSGNVQGAGNANYVAKFNGTNTIISSIIYDNGTNVGVGTAQPNSTLHVAGNITVTQDSDVCIDGGTCLSSRIASFFYGKTAALYAGSLSAGSLTGYEAGDAICNASFSGTHLCSMSEISYTIATQNLSLISGWTGEAWIATGPAKYSPASLPVNDCNGFTHGAAGSYLGNWWSFNQLTGGVGKAGQCGNTLSLGCCK